MEIEEEDSREPRALKLLELSARRIAKDARLLDSFTNNIMKNGFFGELRQNDVEGILNQFQNVHADSEIFEYLIDGQRFPTSILPINSKLRISDETFAKILVGQQETLRKVDLEGNKTLGSDLLLDLLIEFKDQLPQLTTLFASNIWMFNMKKDCIKSDSNSSLELPPPSTEKSYSTDLNSVIHFLQFFPSIEHFRHTLVEDFCPAYETRIEFMSRILHPLHRLNTLELNKWSKLSTMNFLIPLSDTLTTLRLYDCPDIKNGMHNIMKLKNLEVLDISQSTGSNGTFLKPCSTLYELVDALPKLRWLDIANTNLCAPPSGSDRPEMRPALVETDVYGLSALLHNLDFISVFHCDFFSPSVKLPAHVICSEFSEQSLIIALKTYMDRPDILQSVLNELFQVYRLDEGANINYNNGLYLIIEALSTHTLKTLQISGTAALFYCIRNATMNPVIKRRVIEVMIYALTNFIDEPVIVRNCCLAFCQLDVPRDISFCYSKMVFLLVQILNDHSADSTIAKVVIHLLNSLACQTGHESKIEVGVFGAIQAVMDHISRKIKRQIVDDSVEVSWSFLWNITDETPSNCELFLKFDGILLFWYCYQGFSNKEDLVRNMLGLIGNIAEVEHLRHYLMEDKLIEIFLGLLDYVVGGIETSYNAAGVLAQLLSDKNWSNVTIERSFITKRIIETTNKWELKSRRFINYRSFAPILRLIPLFDAPGSQIWSLWAIANLTTTDREKYCNFVIKEGGLELLHKIQMDSRSNELMLSLTKTILNNIQSTVTIQ